MIAGTWSPVSAPAVPPHPAGVGRRRIHGARSARYKTIRRWPIHPHRTVTQDEVDVLAAILTEVRWLQANGEPAANVDWWTRESLRQRLPRLPLTTGRSFCPEELNLARMFVVNLLRRG